MSTLSASPDVLRLLAAFMEPPKARHIDWALALGIDAPASLEVWQRRHTETFLEHCYPYASVYLDRKGAIGGEAADRVADFRRLLGARSDGPADALTDLLIDYAALVERARDDPRARHACRALLWEHLLCWLMPYLDSVRRAAPAPYRGWASIMQEVFRVEARASNRPEQLPLHLRSAPAAKIDAANRSLDDIISALLVPIRSGLVWTRQDLVEAAEAIGVTAGVGSRHFLLHMLLRQEPYASLRRLAALAHAQAEARDAEQALLGPIAEFWRTRADATAHMLDTMAAQIDHRSATPSTSNSAQSA